MNKKEVVISWPVLIVAIVFVVLVLAVAISIAMVAYINAPKPVATSTPTTAVTPTTLLTEDKAKVLAEGVAQAYFTVDYNQPDKWIASFVPFTDDGSQNDIKTFYQPLLWPIFTSGKVVSKASLASADIRGSGVDNITGKAWQIWTVKVSLDLSWPVFPSTIPTILFVPWPDGNTASANIMFFQVGEEWKFAMFLNENSVSSMIASSNK